MDQDILSHLRLGDIVQAHFAGDASEVHHAHDERSILRDLSDLSWNAKTHISPFIRHSEPQAKQSRTLDGRLPPRSLPFTPRNDGICYDSLA